MVTQYKNETNDTMAMHRGVLGLIRLFREGQQGGSNGIINKYETQVLGQGESRCEFFQVVHLNDGKSWFIVSLHEDGSLLLSLPEKIPKHAFESEIELLKESAEQKGGKLGDNDPEDPLSGDRKLSKAE